MALDLKQRAPKFLQGVSLWSQFLDSVTTELLLLQNQMSLKESYLDIDSYTDIDDLIEVGKWFGYDLIRSLNENDLDYSKQDIKSIVYKIKKKGTLQYYNYVFNLVPYTGKVYSLVYETAVDKMWKAIDLVSSSSILSSSHDITTPFLQMESVVSNGYTYSNKYGIDAYLQYLEDNSVTVRRTQGLTFEYLLKSVLLNDSTEYLMYDNYFHYLEQAINYGRKITIIPHVGCQLNIRTDETGYFDSNDPGASYSVADLQMQSTTTGFYDGDATVQLYLDDNRLLDSPVQWYLDNDDETVFGKTSAEKFYYFYAGNNSNSLIPLSDTEYYSLNNNITLYYPLDQEKGRTVTDIGPNEDDGKIYGEYSYVDGIVGNGLQFDGISTTIYHENYVSVYTDTTYCFWLKGLESAQLNTSIYLWEHSITITFNTTTNLLTVTIAGLLSTVTLTKTIDLLDDTERFVLVSLDIDGNALLYINNVLQDTVAISAIGEISSAGDLYIGSSDGNYAFKGIMDEIRIFSYILTSAQRTYLYSTPPNSLATMGNLIYRQRVSENQIYEDSDRYIIQGWVPSKTVNQEIIAEGDSSTNLFSGTLFYDDIIKTSITITYTSGGIEKTITDNGEGSIGDLMYSGSDIGNITYLTGVWSLTATATPDDDTFMYIEYKTGNDVQITELALASDDEKVVAYATFPPIQFKNEKNHVSPNFIIDK